MTEPKKTVYGYFAVGPNVWARGISRAQAMKRLRKAYGRGNKNPPHWMLSQLHGPMGLYSMNELGDLIRSAYKDRPGEFPPHPVPFEGILPGSTTILRGEKLREALKKPSSPA
jgi:hypothetical protein